MLWFLIPAAVLAAFYGTGKFAYARRMRRRERAFVLGDLKDFARMAADPAAAKDMSFTGPHRDDADRTHDTMFSATHGHRRLSFILDTSRWRIRWWILSEILAVTGERTARFEATFIEDAIPSEAIRDLLKTAREYQPAAVEAPPAPQPADHEPAVDPFQTFPDTTAQA